MTFLKELTLTLIYGFLVAIKLSVYFFGFVSFLVFIYLLTAVISGS